jgi:choline dehydrogenase-like flavoprotein
MPLWGIERPNKMQALIYEDVIIGSGPNGWAAAKGVWARKGSPLIIDIGHTPQIVSGESVIRNPKTVPKTLFGSDFMYRFPTSKVNLQLPDVTIPLTGALGGLSTVWGSGIQPVSIHDLSGVPAWCVADWLESSRQLLLDIDYLGRDDLLSQRDPWPVTPHDTVVLSNRFSKILKRADEKFGRKKTAVVYGSPRLAIRGSANKIRPNACTVCGECMIGCRENSIFDAGRELKTALSRNGGDYLEGLVTKVSDENGIAEIQVSLSDGTEQKIYARRVYLAAGPIGTPVLLQRSGLLPQRVVVHDSQMFVGGFWARDKVDKKKPFMTTSQGYFSTSVGELTDQEFSMSVYENSEELKIALRGLLPKPFKGITSIIAPVFSRLVPGIGFLAQEVSGSIVIDYDGQRTVISTVPNPRTPKALKLANRKIRNAGSRIGLFSIPNPFSKLDVGSGFHSGAGLPMGDAPNSLVNWFGQLIAFKALHIVDASSLPRIRAGSHTFMAMANAYRIAVKRESH